MCNRPTLPISVRSSHAQIADIANVRVRWELRDRYDGFCPMCAHAREPNCGETLPLFPIIPFSKNTSDHRNVGPTLVRTISSPDSVCLLAQPPPLPRTPGGGRTPDRPLTDRSLSAGKTGAKNPKTFFWRPPRFPEFSAAVKSLPNSSGNFAAKFRVGGYPRGKHDRQ